MPLIQITANENALSKSDQDKLISKISNAVLKAENAPLNHEGAQSLTWAYCQEIKDGGIYVGGKNIDTPPMRIAITTPKGALDVAGRQSLVAEIGAIIDDIVGSFDGRLNQWTMLYELDEGSWAGSGQIFPLAGIQDAMGIKAA